MIVAIICKYFIESFLQELCLAIILYLVPQSNNNKPLKHR